MKIVYSAGNRLGAAHQLLGFLEQTSHDVKIAAFQQSGRFLPFIDWTLDSISPEHQQEQLQLDIAKYNPDLIIIDGEPIVANIAAVYQIPIVYCSPLHAFDGIQWKRGQLSYSAQMEDLRKMLNKLPVGVAKLMNSPFGDLETPFSLREGYEWIRPYHISVDNKTSDDNIIMLVEDGDRLEGLHKIIGNHKVSVFTSLDSSYEEALAKASIVISTGETRHIADAVYNNKTVYVIPNVKDAETLVNAILVTQTNIGTDLGQLELMNTFGSIEIDGLIQNNSIRVNNRKMLHERVDELWCT